MSRRIKVSANQRPMLAIDDSENVTYYINGFPQTLEDLLDYDPDLSNTDLSQLTTELQLMGYEPEVATQHSLESIEKEDDRTVLLSISDLEKIKKILTAIPQFRDLAAAQGQDIDSIEFLAQAVDQVDFMSLPHFEVDMSIFDLLPKDNLDYREFIFGNILYLVNQVSVTKKFPSKRYLHQIFIDFTPEQIEVVYQLIKRFLGMLNAWGGIQIHLFEQTIRDWLYIVYERGCHMNQQEIFQYLKLKYPCKPDYELMYLADMFVNSISFNPNLEEFVSEFLNFMYCFTPEENIFLTTDETFRLWTSDFLKNRVKAAAAKWSARISAARIVTPENELDAFFGVTNRLTARSKEGMLPTETFGTQSINESVIKLKLYFPEGHRTLIEARVDRLCRLNGRLSLFDWKTTKKELEELNDYEKLQIILQCIAAQNVCQNVKEGQAFEPMVNKDYKFFLNSTSLQWLNTSALPDFYHIPENSEQLYEYVALNIPTEEADRLLASFSRIVNFLICNKKVMAKIKRHLKNIDGYINAPKLEKPVVSINSVSKVAVEA